MEVILIEVILISLVKFTKLIKNLFSKFIKSVFFAKMSTLFKKIFNFKNFLIFRDMIFGYLKSNTKKIAIVIPLFISLIVSFAIADSTTKVFLYIDGEKIGCIENVEEAEKLIMDYNEFANSNFAQKEQTEILLKSEVSLSSPALNGQDLRNGINSVISEDFTDAYTLYIDDIFILASSDMQNIKNTISKIENDVSTLLGHNAAIYNSIEIKNTFYPTNKLTQKENIYKTLTTLDSLSLTDISKSVILDGKTPVKLYSVNGILFETFEYYKVEREVECEIKYVEDDTLFVGSEVLAVTGKNGTYVDTYKKTVFEGTEQSSEIITTTILESKVDTIIKVGTKPINWEEPSKMLAFPLSTSDYTLTSTFGWRDWDGDGTQDFHTGIDWGVNTGSNVLACDSGTVILAEYNYGNAGTTIIIEHANGLKTQYMHMSKLLAKVGDKVYRGQVIGLSGNTGQSSGPHLHLSVYDRNGNRCDPKLYLERYK